MKCYRSLSKALPVARGVRRSRCERVRHGGEEGLGPQNPCHRGDHLTRREGQRPKDVNASKQVRAHETPNNMGVRQAATTAPEDGTSHDRLRRVQSLSPRTGGGCTYGLFFFL